MRRIITFAGYSDDIEFLCAGTLVKYKALGWNVGIMNVNRNALWTTNGYPAYGYYMPSYADIIAKDHEDSVNGWLYYEVAVTPYSYFGGRRGNPSIVSPLQMGKTIMADVTVVGNNNGSYTGMKPSGHVDGGGWSSDYTRLAKHLLVRNGVQGTITLHGFNANTLRACAKIVITDANNVSETHNVVLDASGTYSFKTALSGNCTAVASAVGFVSKSVSVTVVNGQGSADFNLSKSVTDKSVADAKKLSIGSDVSLIGSITAIFGDSISMQLRGRRTRYLLEFRHNIAIGDGNHKRYDLILLFIG